MKFLLLTIAEQVQLDKNFSTTKLFLEIAEVKLFEIFYLCIISLLFIEISNNQISIKHCAEYFFCVFMCACDEFHAFLPYFPQYAGFNSTLRQGNVTHHEYIQVLHNLNFTVQVGFYFLVIKDSLF